MEARLALAHRTQTYRLSLADGKALAWLHAHGKVVDQRAEEEYIHVDVQLSDENQRRFEGIRNEI